MDSMKVVKLGGVVLLMAAVMFMGSGEQVAAQELFGLAHLGPDGPSTLYTVDPTTGVATPVGPTGFERCSGMDFDASETLFATCERTDGSNTHVLITIDPATGAGTEVGPTGVEGLGFGDTVSDISFRNVDGVLYAYLEASDGLGTIDPQTGAAMALGPTNVSCCGNGMAFTPDDTLLHANQDALHTLDQTTGIATFVTAVTYPSPADNFGRANAMDVQPETGVLFASVRDDDGENFLATIDTETGEVTIIGLTVEGLDAIAWSVVSISPCTLNLEANSLDGTLSLDIELGTREPATWNVWLIAEAEVTSLVSVELPVIDPPILVDLSLPFFPSLGTVGLLTTLTTPEAGIICSDFVLVDTGPVVATLAHTVQELREAFGRLTEDLLERLGQPNVEIQ